MSSRHLVDPEIAPVLDLVPAIDLATTPIEEIRARPPMMPTPEPLIAPEIVNTPGRDGAPDVPLYIYNPPSANRKRAALLHIHGGGMVLGSAEASKGIVPPLILPNDAVGVSVEYRLAPETPFPGPQEDCYAALDWLVANADSLGVDPQRIVVGGESAGGGLAAMLALMARDRGEYTLAGQLLVYPMLDHRTGGADCQYRNAFAGEFIWDAAKNAFGWGSLKGGYGLDDERIGWFSPSRADNLSNLPPCFIATGALDLFFDENLDYIRRLGAAGVPVELHVYPGGVHGFNLIEHAQISKACARDIAAAAARFLSSAAPASDS